MSTKPSTISTAASAIGSWLRRNILPVIIGISVLAGLGFLRSCYFAGQVKQVLDTNPKLLGKRKIARLEAKVQDLTIKQAQSQRQADSAYARAQFPERDAALRQHLIDSLTTTYYALSADTALADPTANTSFLQHYVPGPAPRL